MSNSVRQGSVLSTYLFALYLDELPCKLREIKAGCCVSDAVLNHICFADDICLLRGSLYGLQELVNVCSSYVISHSIAFNCKKDLLLCCFLAENLSCFANILFF